MSNPIQTQICEHLDILENSFANYFDFTYLKAEIWLHNPFFVNLNTTHDLDLLEDELIYLKSKKWHIMIFEQKI